MAFLEENNPKSYPHGHFTAHIALYVSFGSYMGAYDDAVTVLYKEVAEGRETPDSIVYPFLFLMRHTLELGYKWTLLGMASYLKKACKVGEFRHSLSKLHVRFGDDVRELCQRLGTKIPDFNRRYVEAESVLKLFEQLDKEEFAFRYPIDRNQRKKAFAAGQTINLLDVKNDYDNAMVLLRHTLNVVGEHIDPDDEWHRKVW